MSDEISQQGSNDTPQVTVVVPTYNRPRLLREALASIAAQEDAPPFNVVVVNDAGCDVAGVLAEFSGALDLQYVNLSFNGGLPAARNAGCERARGRYLAHLDDDDLFLPNHLSQLAGRLRERPEVGLVYGDALLLRQRLVNDSSHTTEQRILAFDYDHATMLRDSFIAPSAMMHRRECFAAVGGFDESLRSCYDDWDFLLRVAALYRIERVAGVSTVIRLRADGSNMSSVVNPERAAAARALQERYNVAPIEPKTFWEVAETISRRG